MGSAGHTCLAIGRAQRACCTDAICSWPAGSLCGMSFICGGEYRLGSTGSTLLGYRRGCRWAIGRVRAAGEGRKGLRATVYVCTGMAESTLLLTLGWIVFTEVSSSSRSGSGSAAGISWCSGIILYFPKLMTRLGQCELEADASPNELNCDSSGAQTKTTTVITGNGGTRNNSVDEAPSCCLFALFPLPQFATRLCLFV